MRRFNTEINGFGQAFAHIHEAKSNSTSALHRRDTIMETVRWMRERNKLCRKRISTRATPIYAPNPNLGGNIEASADRTPGTDKLCDVQWNDDEFIKFARPSQPIHAEPINTHNLDLITIINRAKYIIIVLFSER